MEKRKSGRTHDARRSTVGRHSHPRLQRVVFTRYPYAYRATPGNVIVDLGAGDAPAVKFTNLSDQRISVRLSLDLQRALKKARLSARPFALRPGGSHVLVLAQVAAGQYFYDGAVGRTALEVQGGSGPGIIVTP